VLEDEIQHGLDHLQFWIDDGRPARAGDDVAKAPTVDAELLEEVAFSIFHGRSSFPTPEIRRLHRGILALQDSFSSIAESAIARDRACGKRIVPQALVWFTPIGSLVPTG
jgi:hypothetical protein